MKKTFYLTAFTFLGFLVSLLAHAGIEIMYIRLLLSDFPRYSLGLSWDVWFQIHIAGSIVLAAVGIALGFFQGRFWWRYIYDEGRIGKWRGHGFGRFRSGN